MEDLVYYDKYEPAMGQGNHAMLPVVGAHVWIGSSPERKVVYRLSGPGRWPLVAREGGGFEDIYVRTHALCSTRCRLNMCINSVG